MNELKNLNDLLAHEVQNLYNIEQHQILGLERMSSKAQSDELKQCLDMHLKQTQEQKSRLERVGQLLEVDINAEGNAAIKGLLFEGEQLFHKDATPETLDAAIISAAQKVEHVEIACYGTAAHLARELGLQEAQDLLSQSLEEEKMADAKLNELAITTINRRAEQPSLA